MEKEVSLQRFIDAQQTSYTTALQEIRKGKKASHWMWYIFPQMKGLGRSSTAQYYGIENMEEAKAYYDHPVLGQRLIEITTALLLHRNKQVQDIFSYPDDVKLHSSLTLFLKATGEEIFGRALTVFFDGKEDTHTLALLKKI